MPGSRREDIYQKVTDHIVAAIEAGAGDWRMPWHCAAGGNVARPINAFSGRAYRGANVLALWASSATQGYFSAKWATYKQWQDLGAQVRKGERSSTIVFWKIREENPEDQETDDAPAVQDEVKGGRRILARGYSVFNAHQVDGFEEPDPEPAPRALNQRIPEAEAFFAATGAAIKHGGQRAFYRPTTDHIQMPPFEAFPQVEDYYSVLGHELTHWTGAKHRLDRALGRSFGHEAYAAEELIAELGAAFLCADLRLSNEPRPDHAAYMADWLQVLKNDKRAIFVAASFAQRASDYIQNLQPPPGNAPLLAQLPHPSVGLKPS